MITASRPDTEASADVDAGAAALATRHRAGLDGLEATRRRSGSDRPRIVIVTVTTFDLDEYVPAALHGGSSGFLPTFEDASPATLVEPVRAGQPPPLARPAGLATAPLARWLWAGARGWWRSPAAPPRGRAGVRRRLLQRAGARGGRPPGSGPESGGTTLRTGPARR
ncbi:hypothetical protein [Streptomyces sp. NRRL F-4474]|uniref:hypothetical protein n=1 Tax=Streptomyces sp. NRRL F-4474 TaxID=1463851 RepID=UPI000ACDD183|nr:hypothetical protein [Streptomyces sp. NRRL F-4474]